MPPSKRNVTLSQLRVGIFVLIAIAVLVFLVLNASGDINPFSRKLHLKARFVDANGLREGSEVRLAGVRVGKVERIVLLEPSPVPSAPASRGTDDDRFDHRWTSRKRAHSFRLTSSAGLTQSARKRDVDQHHTGLRDG